ncbi:hypothetical protein Bbelb_086220 [Branchiostoma belcheri]|nr:hypothetical protein Bbelb_086220 [Branchiostoma belcheri]
MMWYTGSGREVSASERLSDVYAYFDLSTAVGHSEPKEGLFRVMGSGREVSASERLSDVYAYFDLSTAVGHSEPKEGLFRRKLHFVTTPVAMATDEAISAGVD